MVTAPRRATLDVPLRTDRSGQRVGAGHLPLHPPQLEPEPKASGVAAYYFANSAYQSHAGRRLAGYIVDALCTELGRADLHKHGRNYACLREVKPLAVRSSRAS